jgi:hypothetical protein
VIFWHYTNGEQIKQLLEQGIIWPSEIPPGTRPIVWFSKNPEWEMGASKYRYLLACGKRVEIAALRNGMVVLNHKQMSVLYDGIFRIGVDSERVPLFRWPGLAMLAGMSESVRNVHEELAPEMGIDPLDWAGSFDPVPREYWHAVERWRNGEWVTRRSEKDAGKAGTEGWTMSNGEPY